MSPTAINGMKCHATSPVATPSGCISCHSNPPAGNAHSKHLALSGVTCDVCHSGAGTNTELHANGTVNVSLTNPFVAKILSLLATVMPKTVTFSYDAAARTCSGVSCHGGLTTPSWNGETTTCISCHGNPPAGNAHSKHLSLAGVTCDACHNGAGANTALHANGTVNVSVATTFVTKTGTFNYNSASGTCSAVSCHGGQPTPSWTTGSAVCTSCHGNPPAGNAHSKHLALSGATCDTCHSGAGAGTSLHANGTVNISHNFNVTTRTCSGVSCHGGQTTPAWDTPSAGCTTCHGNPPVGTGHSTHLALSGATCATCHSGAGAGTPLHANGTVNISHNFNVTTRTCSAASCHGGQTSPIWNSPSAGCATCHGNPPSGAAHSKHLALTGVTCDVCHSGASAYNVQHANGTLDVSVAPTYKAKTGTLGYRAVTGSCSAVICHGGQATPAWKSETITVATDCLKCHEQGTASQAPQYNSFYSGQWSFGGGSQINLHQLHLLSTDTKTTPFSPIVCTNCHNTTILATGHFSGLTTTSFEVTAASTIGSGTTKISVYNSGTCTTSCHVDRKWLN
jgi:predicted CxxxxCH...CXXCH cytochrome family protein